MTCPSCKSSNTTSLPPTLTGGRPGVLCLSCAGRFLDTDDADTIDALINSARPELLELDDDDLKQFERIDRSLSASRRAPCLPPASSLPDGPLRSALLSALGDVGVVDIHVARRWHLANDFPPLPSDRTVCVLSFFLPTDEMRVIVAIDLARLLPN